MKVKICRIGVVFITCFLFAYIASSQDVSLEIKNSFEKYTAYSYQEKVFLHVNKTVYLTGEMIWFKCYVTNGSNSLSQLSKICYVEVLGNDKRSVLQAKVSIDSGTGNGSIVIPASVRTGNYQIRAYTNWMKNFESSFYFHQQISIVNPAKKPEAAKRDSASVYSVQLFPEGGNLVYGLQSKVAFKIAGAFGKGIAVPAAITDNNNDTVAKFAPRKFGMGTFEFTPIKGQRYKIVAKIDGNNLVYDLPKIYDNGCVMQLKDDGTEMHVVVKTNIESINQVFLIAQTRGSVKIAKMQFVKDGIADFLINKSLLGEGISQLTIFNDAKQPLCERLYFKRPSQLKISVANISVDVTKRKKIDLHISTRDPAGKAINAQGSVSVFLIDSLQREPSLNILNYLWLSSEIKGNVESPEYYFTNTGAEANIDLDNLMLTQGWRRFKWEEVLKNTKPSFTFLPEKEGHIITGKILATSSAVPDTGVSGYLAVPGNNFKFTTVKSSGGIVNFNVGKFYGSHEIITQPAAGDSSFRIALDNPFSEKHEDLNIDQLDIGKELKEEILIRSIGAQSENIYLEGISNNYTLPEAFDTTAFFGFPSKTYYLDNYTRFRGMEEVMREYVKEVHVRNRQNTFHFEVYNELAKLYFNEDPLVLIDGVPVFNFNKIMEIDPLNIEKIDVVTTRVFLGSKIFDGIVSYSTYDGDLKGYELSPASLIVEYDGLQLEREFYSPKYDTEDRAAS
ncbi:MAG: hypothetical protein ABI683_11380, partial [Ginsengibacter sp.]